LADFFLVLFLIPLSSPELQRRKENEKEERERFAGFPPN
jgi:hypothetical protein